MIIVVSESVVYLVLKERQKNEKIKLKQNLIKLIVFKRSSKSTYSSIPHWAWHSNSYISGSGRSEELAESQNC